MREIGSGSNISTCFPVSFNPCIVLSKVCHWSFSLQLLKRMLLTFPLLFPLPSNHLRFSLSHKLNPKADGVPFSFQYL